MPAPVAGIHALLAELSHENDEDGPDERGHDDGREK
jgi:hypothetical protein